MISLVHPGCSLGGCVRGSWVIRLSFEGQFMCLEQEKSACPGSGCLGPWLREPCREQERKKNMSGKQYQRWLYLLRSYGRETYGEAGKASEWGHRGYCCCWLLMKTGAVKKVKVLNSAFRPFSSFGVYCYAIKPASHEWVLWIPYPSLPGVLSVSNKLLFVYILKWLAHICSYFPLLPKRSWGEMSAHPVYRGTTMPS